MEEAKKSVCEEKVNFLFCGQSVSRPTGQMAARTPGIWDCFFNNVGPTCENSCATHLLHMSYGCATHVSHMCHTCAFVCLHWSIGHIEALEHWTPWPNKGWMPGRWLFGAWAMSWFSTLAAPLGWSGRKKRGSNTNTRELTRSAMYRIKSEFLENKQNLCRNQDGVLVTAPNALEQNLRRLVSWKTNIMGRWWWHFRFWVNHLWMDIAPCYYIIKVFRWMDGWMKSTKAVEIAYSL